MKLAKAWFQQYQCRAHPFDSTFTPVIFGTQRAYSSLGGDSSSALNGTQPCVNLLCGCSRRRRGPQISIVFAISDADGIDMLKDLTVTAFERTPAAPLSRNGGAARLPDEQYLGQIFNAHATLRIWSGKPYMARRESPTFYQWFGAKCRSFQWYAEINGDLVTCWRSQKKSGRVRSSSETKEGKRKSGTRGMR
jgi:hypothetical protein